MTLTDPALTHRNLLEYGRWTTGLEDGTRMHDGDGVLALAFSTDWPSFRQAVRSDESTPPRRWVSVADDFLSEWGDTACIFVRVGVDDDADGVLTERGYHEFGRVPSMLCDTPPDEREPVAGVAVRLADSADDVAAYAAVAGSAFVDLGLLEDPTRALLDNPDVMLADDVVLAVGELDGRIVAGAFTTLLDDGASGYVSFVSVLAEARGHALGDAVTRRITREAFARGATSLSLEASKFGANTYRRMGYRDLFEYRLMIRLGRTGGA
jgi:ribosomal protein S18 acetylase RimI-like enzyme